MRGRVFLVFRLAVKDLRNDKQAVNLSVLSTFYGNKIYTITLYYLSDYNPQVKTFAEQAMNSLKVEGATGPLGVEQQIPTTMPPVSGTAPAKPAGHA